MVYRGLVGACLAATALGNFADQRAVDVLAKVLSDKDSDPEKIARQKGIRWACGKALSRIFKRTGLTPTDDVFTVLMENTTDGDIDMDISHGVLRLSACVRPGAREAESAGSPGGWQLNVDFGDLIAGDELLAVQHDGVLLITLPKAPAVRR